MLAEDHVVNNGNNRSVTEAASSEQGERDDTDCDLQLTLRRTYTPRLI